MENAKDSLIDLERHRLRLEENIHELQRALQHWRTWDAEYEALKEEVQAADEASGPAELDRIRAEFEGELVNQKEVGDIFGVRTVRRGRDQIVNVLERRIDYVSKNIETLQKQLDAVEQKHAAASIVSQPDMTDDEGQPMTEIVEHLDDDDNILSFKLNRPGESLDHVREALQKAGVKELPPVEGDSSRRPVTEVASDKHDATPAPKPAPTPASSSQPTRTQQKGKAVEKLPAKKGVSFADDTKAPEPPKEQAPPPVSRAARRVEDIMKAAEDQNEIMKQQPVIPDDEDEDDAALRQEMLKYSMGDFGAVVAELDLEEGTSDMEDEWDYSDEGFGEGDDDDDDDMDDEDKYGRSTLRIVTPGYEQRMRELEKKHGVESKSGAQKKTADEADEDSDSDSPQMGRITVRPESSTSSSQVPGPEKSALQTKQEGKKPEKKGVRFADSLDIAPDAADAPASAAKPEKKTAPAVEPLSEVVMERSAPSSAPKAAPRKASRFKKAREGGALPLGPMDVPPSFVDEDRPVAPTGPKDATLADKLVERDTPAAQPVDNDEFFDDYSADMDAIADEHQRLRRKFIQRQGGFLKEDESPIQPLDETEGGPVRPSRFKAARLSRQ